MTHVYAFNVADVNNDEELPAAPEKHLTADSFEDALVKANQWIVDDNLRDKYHLDQGCDYQVVSMRRLMRIDLK